MSSIFSSEMEITRAAHFSGAVYAGGLVDYPTPSGFTEIVDSSELGIQFGGFYGRAYLDNQSGVVYVAFAGTDSPLDILDSDVDIFRGDVIRGSTPFSRTVIKRLKTPDHALPIVFASVDCESAQCS